MHKGHYAFRNVYDAHEIRRKAIKLPEWVDYMAKLLTLKYKNLTKSKRYHRWFDSGDMQSFAHMMKIFEVLMRVDTTYKILVGHKYPVYKDIKQEDVPKNLCLRAS